MTEVRGEVHCAGGGHIDVRVDRDTTEYIPVNQRVVVRPLVDVGPDTRTDAYYDLVYALEDYLKREGASGAAHIIASDLVDLADPDHQQTSRVNELVASYKRRYERR